MIQNAKHPEDQVFDALEAVFALEPFEALNISKQVACQIAGFVADVGGMAGDTKTIDWALGRIEEMQSELHDLSHMLAAHRDTRTAHVIH